MIRIPRRSIDYVTNSSTSTLKNANTRLISTCRAVVLPRFGGPEVLEVRHNVGLPDLGASEVLVRTAAVGINPLDCRMRSGYGRSLFEPLLPLILGRDVSGEVAALGSSVRQLHVGQEVFGALHPTAVRGTYSDYAILSEDELVPKPPSVTHVEASAIPFAALTAWRALKSTARISTGSPQLVHWDSIEEEPTLEPFLHSLPFSYSIYLLHSFPYIFQLLTFFERLVTDLKVYAAQKHIGGFPTHFYLVGQRVLVIGGGGAVGLAAIQLSVAAGCKVVTTCGKLSIDRVMAAGAEKAIDYTSEDLRTKLEGRFHAVLDTIGLPETEILGVDLLKRGGNYMTLQGEVVSLADTYGLVVGGAAASAKLLKKQVQYRQSHGVEYWWIHMRTDFEGLEEIARLTRAGKMKIPVGKTFPLGEAAEAHHVKESKLASGKVVLEID